MPKQSNHKSLARQWEMLHQIPAHGYGLMASEICEKLAGTGYPVCKRTVERDLEELSDFFEIEADDSYPRRWRWRRRHDSAIGAMTVVEAVSLRMIEEHLRANLPKAMLQALEGRFRRARKFLKNCEDNNRTTWPERVATVPPVFPLLPPVIPEAILETVQRSVLDGLCLDAEYCSKDRDTARAMLLHPLGLVQQGVALYLVATANDHEEPRLFAVHRLQSVNVRSDKVIRPKGFTLKDYMQTGAFQFGSGEMIAFKAQVTQELAGYLTETPLSSDQTMTPQGEFVTLDATLRNTWQLRFWILSQGASITVLEPKSLRDSIRTTLNAATANYL